MPAAAPVESLIEREFDELSPELQRAARWVRDHGAALALGSMRRSAREAGVSPATMTRLAQRLGFGGFEALRQPFVDRLAAGAATRAPLPYARRALAQQRRGGRLDELAALQSANVAAAAARNTPAALERAAQLMLRAERVHFLGLRVCHGIAFHLHYAYGLLCGNGQLVGDAGDTLTDQMVRVGRGHVLVAVSQQPYTRSTVDSVQQAQAQGASIVALTDSALSPIARAAHRVLLYETASNSYFHSTTGALALSEALLATVSTIGGDAVLRHLRARQKQLVASRAYWQAPRLAAPAPST